MLIRRLAIYTALALLGGYALAFRFGAPEPNIAGPMFILSGTFIATCAVAIFVGYLIWLVLVEREQRPIERIRADCGHFLRPSYLVEKLGPMVLAFMSLGAFGTYKSLITHIIPFYLDGPLSDLDRLMLGTDGWRLTHSVAGPFATWLFELAYRLWFAELSFALLYFSIFGNEELKRRFFLSFFAMWAILGFFAATALSSAGPCFLGLIHHPYADRYADLMPLLKSAPVALDMQHMLANAYEHGAAGAFLGISAMPSLHVSLAALVVLAARHVNKAVFAGALVFYAFIVVGSVHLGFHYLSDAMVGTLGTVLIWNYFGSRQTMVAGADMLDCPVTSARI